MVGSPRAYAQAPRRFWAPASKSAGCKARACFGATDNGRTAARGAAPAKYTEKRSVASAQWKAVSRSEDAAAAYERDHGSAKATTA